MHKLLARQKWAKQTIETLAALQRHLGMTENLFLQMHHFRNGPKITSIEEHRSYCLEGERMFHIDGNNVDVLRRLLLARYLREEQVGWPEVINATLAAFPFENAP
jgi:hypothetical protein